MHIKTTGIVLREAAYKESDKILTVLTAEGGKRTVKARGCRGKSSRTAAACQVLVYSDLTLTEYRDFFTLGEADSLEQFWNLRNDLDKLALGSYFAEVTEAVAEEGMEQPELLSLLLNSLYALDKLQKPLPLVKAAFEVRLMCVAGYEPMLDGCALCGAETPTDGRLNLSEGVLHCAGCKEEGGGISLPVSPQTICALRHIAYGDPKRIFSFALDEDNLRQLGDVSEAFLATQLERGFRTLDFYKSLHTEGIS
ncbi:MAG: DNA repair protein RecO [Oscillospiraceae bacterium]